MKRLSQALGVAWIAVAAAGCDSLAIMNATQVQLESSLISLIDQFARLFVNNLLDVPASLSA